MPALIHPPCPCACTQCHPQLLPCSCSCLFSGAKININMLGTWPGAARGSSSSSMTIYVHFVCSQLNRQGCTCTARAGGGAEQRSAASACALQRQTCRRGRRASHAVASWLGQGHQGPAPCHLLPLPSSSLPLTHATRRHVTIKLENAVSYKICCPTLLASNADFCRQGRNRGVGRCFDCVLLI